MYNDLDWIDRFMTFLTIIFYKSHGLFSRKIELEIMELTRKRLRATALRERERRRETRRTQLAQNVKCDMTF